MAPSRPGSGRTALILLSAPGAGADLVSEVLALAGAAPPADPAAVADLNDRALAALGSGRDDPFGPRRRGGEPASPPEALLAEAGALAATVDPHSALLALADPAAARLADFWTRALEAQGWRTAFLLLVRAPAEAAAAQAAASGATRNRALFAWASHMLEAERASRGARRVVVAYARLRAEPEAELDRIERALALRLPHRTWDSAAEIDARLAAAGRPPAATPLPEALAPLNAFADHLLAAAADEPGNADVPAETERWFTALTELAAPSARRPAAMDPPSTASSAEAAPDPAVAEGLGRRAAEAEARADTAEAQVAILQSALAVSRRRAAEAETLLQARATEASAGEREARAALSDALAGREAAELRLGELDARAREMAAQIAELDDRLIAAAEALSAETEALSAEAEAGRLGVEAHRAQAAELGDERDRHRDAREQLALTGVSRHAALTRVRELEARLAEAERRRSWLSRMFERR